MGRAPSGNAKYQITHFWARHKKILRLHHEGWSNIQIADSLGITPQTVSLTINSPLAVEELQKMDLAEEESRLAVKERIEEIVPRAVDILEDMMEAEETPTPVRERIANKFLDRAGHAAPTKVQGSFAHAVGQIPSEVLDDIKKAARAAGSLRDDNDVEVEQAQVQTEDAEYTEVKENETSNVD